LTEIYLNRSVNNSEIYNPIDAEKAGFLDKVVPENKLLPTAIKAAEMFSKLHRKAHAETKLKVRRSHLESLSIAIQLDLNEEISINP